MIVIVAQKSYLVPMTKIINQSGLNLTTIDIHELSLRNILALFEQENTSIALVYLQEKNSKIIVMRQKTFYFARRMDWGINLVSKNASNEDVLNRNVDKLSLEIQRSFDYYQSQWRSPAPTKIILVAESQLSFDITKYLSERMITSYRNWT